MTRNLQEKPFTESIAFSMVSRPLVSSMNFEEGKYNFRQNLDNSDLNGVPAVPLDIEGQLAFGYACTRRSGNDGRKLRPLFFRRFLQMLT